MTCLVVQRDPRLRDLLCRRLDVLGVEAASAADPVDARRQLRKGHSDLVVCDLDPRDEPGFQLATEVRQWWPEIATVGFGAHDDQSAAAAVIEAGIDEYISEESIDAGLELAVTRALRRRDDRVASRAEIERVRTVRAIAADKRPDDPLGEQVLERLARAGRFRDEETAEHVERVSRSCALIARSLGWDSADCAKLRAASAMHDVGKVGVPDAVLLKPGKLNAEERKRIEAHAEIGYHILTGSGDDLLEFAATIALTHQERFDGTGYPHGLAGEAIPIAGRIAAVADVFDALTHDRVYREAFSVPEALKILRDGSGTHFDPAVLKGFEGVQSEIEDLLLNYPDSDRGGEHHPLLFAGPDVPARVLLVEQHGAVARGLELLLRREGIEIAGTAGSVLAARRLIARRGTDLLVVDPALEGESAVELIPVARERGIKVLLYTDTQNGSAVEAARNSGAEGVIAKSGTPAQFLEAIRVVSRGETYRDPQVHPYAGAESPPDLLALTAREREIATLLSKGLTGEQIAKLLFLSPETVRTHVRNAMGRTGAKTRAHLAALVASVPRPDSIAAPKRSLRDASPSRRRQRGR